MPYGTIKVDNIIFTNSGSDQTVTVSGLYASTSGNLTVTGTVSGTTANFVSGTFSTQLSGATITGGVARFTTVTGVSATLTTATITSGIFAAGTATAPSVAIGVGTTYTPGIYAPGTDQVAISTSGTGRLFVSSSGNVGIGTSSPSQLLQVNGNVLIGATPAAQYSNFTVVGDSAIQAASPLFNFVNAAGSTRFGYINHTGTGGDIYILNQEAGAIRLGSNNQERLRITSAGDVGIGTTGPAPGSKLEVVGTIRAQSGGNIVDLTSDGGIELTKSTGPYIDFKTSNVDFDCRIEQANNGFVFWTGGAAASEKLRILANGNVGIGTSNPGSRLHVSGTADLLRLDSSSTELGILLFDSVGGSRVGTRSANIIFDTNSLERLRINSSGNVGIGTSNPGTKLDVAGQIRALDTVDLRLNPIPAGNAGIVGTYSSHDLVFYRNGAETARIDSSGRLLVGTSTARSNLFNSSVSSNVLQIERANDSAGLSIVTNNAAAGTAYIALCRSAGTTLGSNALLGNGNVVGTVAFQASDGSEFVDAARIEAYVDGDAGANDTPGRLVFSTTADGASSPTERMRITSAGYFKASNNGSYISTTSTEHEFNQSQANWSNIVSYASNVSFASSTYYAQALRAANSAYFFFIGNSGNGADNEFVLYGDGNGKCDGSWTGGGADYAEYFEWSDGNLSAEDRRGISVVLDGDKIRPALTGEDPFGVISGNPSVVGDAAWNKWSGKYLRDDYGTYIQEDYEVEDEDGNSVVQQRRKLNPAYDPDVEYTSREQRPEWDCVGLMGKLRIRKGQPTGARWIKMRDISPDVEEWLVR